MLNNSIIQKTSFKKYGQLLKTCLILISTLSATSFCKAEEHKTPNELYGFKYLKLGMDIRSVNELDLFDCNITEGWCNVSTWERTDPISSFLGYHLEHFAFFGIEFSRFEEQWILTDIEFSVSVDEVTMDAALIKTFGKESLQGIETNFMGQTKSFKYWLFENNTAIKHSKYMDGRHGQESTFISIYSDNSLRSNLENNFPSMRLDVTDY